MLSQSIGCSVAPHNWSLMFLDPTIQFSESLSNTRLSIILPWNPVYNSTLQQHRWGVLGIWKNVLQRSSRFDDSFNAKIPLQHPLDWIRQPLYIGEEQLQQTVDVDCLRECNNTYCTVTWWSVQDSHSPLETSCYFSSEQSINDEESLSACFSKVCTKALLLLEGWLESKLKYWLVQVFLI